MLANWTLDQWFIAGIVLVVVIGLWRRSFRSIVILGIIWVILYWPTMFAGAMFGDAADKFERDSNAEPITNAPLEPGYLGPAPQ